MPSLIIHFIVAEYKITTNFTEKDFSETVSFLQRRNATVLINFLYTEIKKKRMSVLR